LNKLLAKWREYFPFAWRERQNTELKKLMWRWGNSADVVGKARHCPALENLGAS
jgi:hypothetical protein